MPGRDVGLLMPQDVDEPAQRVPDIEAAHAPGLACWAVLDHEPGLSHATLDLIKVIHLNRDVRHWRPRTAFGCDAYLRCHLRGRGKRDDPPLIHYDFKAEDAGVEVSGLRHVGRGKVGDDALDDHVRMLSAQERALLTRSDGDDHDYRHACRRLHTQRRGRPGLFQRRAWLFLRRCRRWMADLCRAAL